MQFDKGMNFVSSDGEKIGELGRVVINPQDGSVSHLIIQKGFLMLEEKVVPIDSVETTREKDLLLKIDKDHVDRLPDFIEADYVGLDELDRSRHGYQGENSPLPLYWYPMAGTGPMTWGGSNSNYVGYPYQVTFEQNIPEGTVALKEGADVVGSDGEQVGSVSRVVMSNKDERLTHLVVTKGLLNKESKLIPAHWITQVKEDSVELSVSSKLVDRLKEYQE